MDKHKRPYKCLLPRCENLQGFTYCGGLRRHEREVHDIGENDAYKRILCPIASCKRASNGFTRKENLEEHIRRMHPRCKAGNKDEAKDTNMAEIQETERALRDEDATERQKNVTGPKREHSLDVSETREEGYDWSKADLWDEVKRLKRDNKDIYKRLSTLEAVAAKF